MQNLYRKGRRDLNEGEIKKYLSEQAIPYLMLGPGQGADMIIWIGDEAVIVEVKNPDTSVARKKLTETEKKFKEYCDAMVITYAVIFSVEEMKALIERVKEAQIMMYYLFVNDENIPS